MSGFEIIEICETTSGDPPKEIPRVDDDNDDKEKWQKLVLYYLARLKGLCDWRNNSRSRTKTNQKLHLKKCSSQDLESRIIDNVTHKPIGRSSTKQNSLHENSNDIGCYLAAGYEEGKQQAVKIISRSLKYGVMTGILLKRGNCYRVAPEYLHDGDTSPAEKKKNVTHHRKECEKCFTRHKFSVKSVKSNVRKKDNKKNIKKRASKYKINEQKKSNTTIRGKKRKRVANNSHLKKKRVNSATSIKIRKGTKRMYDENSDESSPRYKRNKRTSDTNVNLNESSNSNTSFQTLSRSITPIDNRHNKRDVKAKRFRPKIQKPINYVPPLKKPRTKSQSKSPSHHTDDDEVRDRENVKNKPHKVINQFRMPRPRRYSDVMSSMSSSSCTICNDEWHHQDQVVKRTRRK